MYERFINELKTCSQAIGILSKGYLPITLIPPSKLEAILQKVKTTLAKTNKNYSLLLNRLYLYYDMKLVTFGIDQDKNLIIQFPVFVAPYMQARLTLYQVETVPVPILNMNNKAESYMQLKIIKPYLALNDETYISLRSQELNTCKKIGYEYFCEEIFVVKSKHKFSCTSAVYFKLNHEIKQNCNFEYHFNKTDITPSVLDSRQNIILANWPSYKRLICTYINNIPVNIPSRLYVLLDRNILCNCDIEAEDNFLLESLATCGENNIQKLEMFYTVKLAFLDHLEDLPEVLDTPIDRNWTHDKQIFPISLESFEINSSLLQAPKTLKDYIKQLQEHNKKLHVNVSPHTTKSNFKGFISSIIADIIGFVAALLFIITALVVIYIVTSHFKLKTLVANIALQCIRTVEVAALNPDHIICETGLEKMLLIIHLAVMTIMSTAKVRKSRIFKGKLFSNSIKVKLFIADNHCYIPLHLNKLAGSVHLLKLYGILMKENLILRKNWIWDILEIDWTDVYLLQDHKEINLPVTVAIPLYYKYKIRQLLKHSRKDPLHLYIILKQRKSWLSLESTECE